MATRKRRAKAAPAELVIEYRAVTDLVPHDRNARTHPPEQVAQIAESIRRYGFNNPILVAGATILAGHGRLAAAKENGLEQAPVIDLGHLDEKERRAFVLADNRIALNAGWSAELLKAEVAELMGEGVDLAGIGFESAELSRIMGPRPGRISDDALPKGGEAGPVSAAGDLWRCGEHRVACGDSTEASAVGTLFAGAEPSLMVTDPPYGVNYDPAWRARAGVGSEGAATGRVLNDDRADWREAWELFPGAVAYVWHGGLHAPVVAESLADTGFEVRAQIVWVKTRHALGRGHYHWQHEPCWYGVREGEEDGWRFVPEHEAAAYAVREGKTANWSGDRKQSTVWFIEHFKSETGHGTQKPVDCMRRPMENNSAPGDGVYDPFLGSGTSLVAAESIDRVCYGMELNPAYVDLAVRRWQEFTGKAATLEGDGRPFDEIAAERNAAAAE